MVAHTNISPNRTSGRAHAVQGFTRPIGQTGAMTIDAISVNDFPTATIVAEGRPAVEAAEAATLPG